jgi:hypothetical protein
MIFITRDRGKGGLGGALVPHNFEKKKLLVKKKKKYISPSHKKIQRLIPPFVLLDPSLCVTIILNFLRGVKEISHHGKR